MVTKKPEQKEEKPKAPSKERVKQLIEEKMEKIRSQEAEGKPVEKESKPEAKPESGEKASKDAFKPPTEKKAPVKSKAKQLPTSVFVTGKRKRAVARASFKQGKGSVKVNSIPLELVRPEMLRLKMMEPLILIGDEYKKFDVKVTVNGGGPTGQADAVRQALARGLSELLGEEARKTFLSYDRNLIVYDPRRTEPHKPPHSSWGPRRYKQRSKR